MDRDGVIITDAHYARDPEQVQLIPGVAAALRRAREAGWRLIGLSNQSGIGRGIITLREFGSVQARMDAELAAGGAWLDALFYCPHAPEVGCRCRKPATGLLEEAARRFLWDHTASWLVGDKLVDIELALAARLRPVLVKTGQGADEAQKLAADSPVLVMADLPAVVEHILGGRPNSTGDRGP